jgi:chlorophyllide a reductase subunit Y
MGLAGVGAIAEVINAAMGQAERFTRMRAFFEGVGTGGTTGVWPTAPKTLEEVG